jgi:hypothetical protein
MAALMRDMNWMARQIEIREKNLCQAIDELSESRRLINEKSDYLIRVNRELAARSTRSCYRGRPPGRPEEVACRIQSAVAGRAFALAEQNKLRKAGKGC